VSTKKKPWHCCCHRWQERKKKKQQGVPSSPMTLRRSGVSLDVIGGTGAADLAAPHECSGGIIHPRGDFAHTLDTVVFAVLAYCAFYTPYRIGFDLQPEGFLLVFELAIDCLFIFEKIVQFRKGYPLDDFDEDSRIEMMPRPIAKNYLKGWFWVDLLAAVPTQLIWGAESSASNRLPRLFRLPTLQRQLLTLDKDLVQHEQLDGIGEERTVVDHVEHTTRCAYHNVHALLEAAHVLTHAGATDASMAPVHATKQKIDQAHMLYQAHVSGGAGCAGAQLCGGEGGRGCVGRARRVRVTPAYGPSISRHWCVKKMRSLYFWIFISKTAKYFILDGVLQLLYTETYMGYEAQIALIWAVFRGSAVSQVQTSRSPGHRRPIW
jgi:hypothetical protein